MTLIKCVFCVPFLCPYRFNNLIPKLRINRYIYLHSFHLKWLVMISHKTSNSKIQKSTQFWIGRRNEQRLNQIESRLIPNRLYSIQIKWKLKFQINRNDRQTTNNNNNNFNANGNCLYELWIRFALYDFPTSIIDNRSTIVIAHPYNSITTYIYLYKCHTSVTLHMYISNRLCKHTIYKPITIEYGIRKAKAFVVVYLQSMVTTNWSWATTRSSPTASSRRGSRSRRNWRWPSGMAWNSRYTATWRTTSRRNPNI